MEDSILCVNCVTMDTVAFGCHTGWETPRVKGREGILQEQIKKKNEWLGLFLSIAIGVVIALCLRQWVASPSRVPSASMYPTIPALSESDSSYILVNKLATEFGQVHRGEVVVFHWPDDTSKLFVKRVVGMPGDTVKVSEDSVYINGKKLPEANQNVAKSNGISLGTFYVPPGHYFMLGDNRTNSEDSRVWKHPYVERSAIVGEADFVLFPLNKIGIISQNL